MVGGDQRVSRFRDAMVNDDYDVQLRLTEGTRNDPAAISRLYVPRQNGELAQVGQPREVGAIEDGFAH